LLSRNPHSWVKHMSTEQIIGGVLIVVLLVILWKVARHHYKF
jgi:hypothetical protein